MRNHLKSLSFPIIILLFLGCESKKLPILGPVTEVDGQIIPHSIPDFSFVNQDSMVVNNETFKDKIYIADFFFTSCPSICPFMKAQMIRIYYEFEEENRLKLLSHSIDTRRDTVGHLKEYAENLGVSSDRWHFVTGDKDEIFEIAEDYFNVVVEDETAPEGFDHSGRFVLVDINRNIRSYCDGTNAKEVDRFMEDVRKLLKEMDVE